MLFPTALATDTSGVVPAGHLDRLAAAGLYGLFGPASAGGLAADPVTGWGVVEVLAGGCLTTTFVWSQHHAALRAVADSTNSALRDARLADLCRGRWRAGIAVAGIRPSVVGVSARPVVGGWLLSGEVPWVTGWGMIDVILTAAHGPDRRIVWTLVDALASPSLTVERLDLVAVHASATMVVSFHDHFVPAERTTHIEPYDDWAARDALKLRHNGSFALGVIGRCCRLLGPTSLDGELATCRDELNRAAITAPEDLPAARAAAAVLAVRAAADLVVAAGSPSVLLDQHPQRLAREAAFVLVAASRPTIQTELRTRLERPPSPLTPAPPPSRGS